MYVIDLITGLLIGVPSNFWFYLDIPAKVCFPLTAAILKTIYKAGAILRAFNPYRAPYIPFVFISICKERYFLIIHKYTKEYSGSQIYSHISLYTLSIQKYTDILVGAKNPFLHIKCIPTLHAHSHAYIDTNARGSIGIIWPYRRPHIIIVLIYYIGIIRYAHPHGMLVIAPDRRTDTHVPVTMWHGIIMYPP